MRSTAMVALIACALLVGCGGSGDDKAATTSSPAPAAASFPAGDGQSLASLVGSLDPGPVLSPTSQVFTPGRTDRFAFALFDTARKQVPSATAAVYLLDSKQKHARGPYPAKIESLDVKAQYQSRSTASDLELNRQIYVAQIPIPRRGNYVVAGIAYVDGKEYRTSQVPLSAGTAKGALPPAVGQKAPIVHTPTSEDVAGNLASIDTRSPPVSSLHEVDAADVIGREPLVLLFATPQFCQSRVCGPVTDVEYQVQSEQPRKDVKFIHMEIYRDNQVSKGFRPQVAAYHLPTEPWAFIIDRKGTVRERFEGAFSAAELSAAVKKVSQP